MPDDTTPKKTRKTARPRLDAVVRHIKIGSYDEEMSRLTEAISERQKVRQEAVLKMVREAFGEQASVRTGPSLPNPPLRPEKPNPFLKGQEEDPELVAAQQAALEREKELEQEAGGLPEDPDDDPNIESRSPAIGSIDSTEQS
jgi:hypothetical protein